MSRRVARSERSFRTLSVALLGVAATLSSLTVAASRQRGREDNPGLGRIMRKEGPCEQLPDAPGRARGHEMICAGTRLGSSAGVARGDFDHDTFADLAIGVPGESIGTLANAGAVIVIYGSADGLTATSSGTHPSQLWTQDSVGVGDLAEQGDEFGSAIASGDFNGDLFSDLAIGVPGEILNGKPTGAVHILYGSPAGLISQGDQLLDPANFRPQADPTERFGSGLTWGDFDNDGHGDLVAEMMTRVGTDILNQPLYLQGVGVMFGSENGIDPFRFEEFNDSVEWAGLARNKWVISSANFDSDGRTELVIADPFFTIDEINQGVRRHVSFTGQVRVFYPTAAGVFDQAPQIWREDTPGVIDSPEGGDQFGSALASGDFNGDLRRDLAIGAVGEDNGAGAVIIIYGTANGLSATAGPGTQLFRQGSGGILGTAESGDHFGASLAANDFNRDSRADLAIGVPNERIGSALSGLAAGAVNVVYGSANGLSASAGPGTQIWTQNSPGVAGTAEYADRFGETLSAWNFGGSSHADLAIGVPGEELTDSSGNRAPGAGAVAVLYGTANGLSSANSQLWTEDEPGVPGEVERDDGFGKAIY